MPLDKEATDGQFLGFKDLGPEVWGLGFKVQGLGCRFLGLGL